MQQLLSNRCAQVNRSASWTSNDSPEKAGAIIAIELLEALKQAAI
jgi:hypothetical protein